jgi:AhpD family alkylhydroperoxidase
LSPLERQIVLLAVSVANSCAYCAAAHGMLAVKLGVARSEVNKLHQGQLLSDARLEQLRRFVETVANQRGRLADSDSEDFIKAGFSQAQILEVVLGVAIKTLTNYAHHIAKPPLNGQFADFRPAWADEE